MPAEPRPEDIPVQPVERVELAFAPQPWRFADERHTDIAAHFASLKARTPELWNGRVLLLHRHDAIGSVFRGGCLETDFASFLAWRDWGFPDVSVHNCFGMAALRSADGAFLLGVMAPHTANAGKCYFPAGTLDPNDIVGGTVDVEGSVRRELTEETGLDADEMDVEPGWHAVLAGPRIAMMKVLQARESAEALRARVLQFVRSDPQPELSDIRIVRDRATIGENVPSHTAAFLHYFWNLPRRQG